MLGVRAIRLQQIVEGFGMGSGRLRRASELRSGHGRHTSASSTSDLAAALGAAIVLGCSATLVRRSPATAAELRVFRAVNDAPDNLEPLMHLTRLVGTLTTSAVVAAGARVTGQHRLARKALVAGPAQRLAEVCLKRAVGRRRPAELVARSRQRVTGPATSGAFPSGHAAAAFLAATLTRPPEPLPLAASTYAAATVVAAARVYQGVHLPLDAVGGAALGVLVGSLARLSPGSACGRPRVRAVRTPQ